MMDGWNATLYDEQIHFVSALGKNLVELLAPKEGERILDLGCGTGDLTETLAQSGAKVTGIDSSPGMIEMAREKYPQLTFETADALDFRGSEGFHAIFSNAVFHWIQQPERLLRNISENLLPGGRLVAEFGGKGNVGRIVGALEEVLKKKGRDFSRLNPWYYPSPGEFGTLLEEQGFVVRSIQFFDRPTRLPGEEQGLRNWLEMFVPASFYQGSPPEKEALYQAMEERLKPLLYQEGTWLADYKRLRIHAEKPLHGLIRRREYCG